MSEADDGGRAGMPGEGLEADMAAVAGRRDRAAFGRVFAFYAPRVKAYLGRLGAADAEADDLAQEAMLAVWRRADRFDPRRAALSTWVFAIARELRAGGLPSPGGGGRPEFDPDDPALAGDADGAAPTGSGEVLRLVRRAVLGLPLDEAERLLSFYYDERPRGTGEATSSGVASDARLRSALGRLRASVETDGADDG